MRAARLPREHVMKRCLIVDDSAVIRKVAKRVLNSEILRILEAGSAGAALAACREDMPEYIILDASLPDMTTLDFLGALREIPGSRRPIVLLMVIELDIVPIMRAKRAGASGYLMKPFDRESLNRQFRDQVEKALRKQAEAA